MVALDEAIDLWTDSTSTDCGPVMVLGQPLPLLVTLTALRLIRLILTLSTPATQLHPYNPGYINPR
ncbi:MAG: hypothetical protein AAGM36_01870 [Cyanobacteria bacterium J06597_1]